MRCVHEEMRYHVTWQALEHGSVSEFRCLCTHQPSLSSHTARQERAPHSLRPETRTRRTTARLEKEKSLVPTEQAADLDTVSRCGASTTSSCGTPEEQVDLKDRDRLRLLHIDRLGTTEAMQLVAFFLWLDQGRRGKACIHIFLSTLTYCSFPLSCVMFAFVF